MPLRVGRMGSAFGEDSTAAAFIRTMSGAWDSVEFFDQSGVSEEPLAVVTFTEPDPVDHAAVDRALDQLAVLIRQSSDSGEIAHLETRVRRSEDSLSFFFDGNESETGVHVDLEFDDGTYVTIKDRREDEGREEATKLPRDHPSRWQESISADEYGSLELLIGQLQMILDECDVDDVTRVSIQGAIDVLRGTHRATEVGETTRAEVLPVVREVVRYMTEKLPAKIVLWGAAIKVLEGWYPSVVQMIRAAVGN